MTHALYRKSANAHTERSPERCPARARQSQRWLSDLPEHLSAWVVAPVSLDVYREYEMQAERVHGRDSANAPCFYEHRYVLTQLRTDDDDMFYEVPVYVEALTSWRLIDERWLVCRTTIDRLGGAGAQTEFTLSASMPR